MTARDLLEDLQMRPFVPLRLYVMDGTIYDIRHPEQCMVGLNSVIVGIPAASGYSEMAPFERMIRIDNSHIHKTEPIGGIATASNGQKPL